MTKKYPKKKQLRKNAYKKLRISKSIQITLNPLNLTLIGAILQAVWILILSWLEPFSDSRNEKLAYVILIASLVQASSVYAYGKWLELVGELKDSELIRLASYLVLVGMVTFVSYWIAFIVSLLVSSLR